jgi:hypothetical protein
MPTDNRRAKLLWKRLTQTYGARFLEQFGKEPTDPWIEAVENLRDEQIAFGLRKITREHVQHPPSLGAFQQACNDMPQPVVDSGPTVQAQLCAYITLTRFDRLSANQQRGPWTCLYREGTDSTQPKHLQRIAMCVGVVIDPDGKFPGHRVMVEDMHTDTNNYNRALQSFKPGPKPLR